MRCELAGYDSSALPLTLHLEDGVPFEKAGYVALGYTNYDVICIGGAGGHAGAYDVTVSGSGYHSHAYGGAGGGGGIHRVQGLLSALPDFALVQVGKSGNRGNNFVGTVPDTSYIPPLTHGSDGGASRFNVNTCKASGGKGGHKFDLASPTTPDGAGGEGGIGNSIVAGGGAAGGAAITPGSPSTPGTDGANGTWDGTIGSGGGGGSGGVGYIYPAVTDYIPARSGGRGAYLLEDQSVYGVGGDPQFDPDTAAPGPVVPGSGGGAKATPLTFDSIEYGFGVVDYSVLNAHGSGDGAVIIRLTKID